MNPYKKDYDTQIGSNLKNIYDMWSKSIRISTVNARSADFDQKSDTLDVYKRQMLCYRNQPFIN